MISMCMCYSNILNKQAKYVTVRDQSILLFFSYFSFQQFFFFQPIMLNILLQAIYYAQDYITGPILTFTAPGHLPF